MTGVREAPSGFAFRRASVDDAASIAEIVNEVTRAEVGLPWTTVEEVRDELTSPGQDPALAPALLLEADGTPVCYLLLWIEGGSAAHIDAFVCVVPRLSGRGLSTWLLRLAEERARSRARRLREPVVVQVSRFANNESAGRLLASLGFAFVRTFWMMRIELDQVPPDPVVPDGIRIRAFRPGRDEGAVHAALTEAFADHWGSPFPAYEEWLHLEVEGEGAEFDPTLWLVAEDGDEVAGAACCRATSPRSEDTALVSNLGVRRRWRRRGIGLALLLGVLAELHRRGIPHA